MFVDYHKDWIILRVPDYAAPDTMMLTHHHPFFSASKTAERDGSETGIDDRHAVI